MKGKNGTPAITFGGHGVVESYERPPNKNVVFKLVEEVPPGEYHDEAGANPEKE